MESVCKETYRVIYISILSNRQKNEKNRILLRKFAKVQEFSYPLMVYTNGDECTATTQTGYQKTDTGCWKHTTENYVKFCFNKQS